MTSPTVALLGTGTMGTGMARTIAGAGLPLRVWNRRRERAEPLAEFGAVVADDPGSAVNGADLAVTMLFDADSVEEVMARTEGHLAPGAVWVQMSTVGLDGERRLAGLADRLGVRYVDAPVLGTRKPAYDGTLTVLASGPEECRAACAPLFDAVGSRTLWVGEAGAGSRLKLVANAWVLIAIEGIAESLALARDLGLDPSLFLAAVQGGAMDAPYVQLKGRAMLQGEYQPAFSLAGAAKDAGLILEAARSAGLELAMTEAAHRHLQRAVDGGHGEKDMAATYLAH